jgi:amidase
VGLEEYALLDATDLARLVRHREVTASELVEAAISRLERAEPRLTGIVE